MPSFNANRRRFRHQGKLHPQFRPRPDVLESRALLSTMTLVKDINLGAAGSSPYDLRNVDGKLMFNAVGTTGGNRAVWKSDGTAAGTVMVKDIKANNVNGGTLYTGVVGSKWYFTASDTPHGSELWVTDGTEAGTYMIKDIDPGSASGGGAILTSDSANGLIYFVADDGTLPRSQVWRSDGTDLGTFKISNIGDTADPSGFLVQYGAGDGMTVASTGLYFVGRDSAYYSELYVSDGTLAGTHLIKNVNPTDSGAMSNGYTPFPELAGLVYFPGNDGVNGWQLWQTDGTEAGTIIAANISSNGVADPTYTGPQSMVVFNGAIYFSQNDGTHGRELRKFVPGVGASMVMDINPGAGDGLAYGEPYGTKLIASGGYLYFNADDGTHGRELWRTDGTPAGTTLVMDINPGSANSNPLSMTDADGILYFAANDGTHGLELWQSDGTGLGTHIVQDLNPGAGGSLFADGYNEMIVNVNGTLYLTANAPGIGTELYKVVPDVIAEPPVNTVPGPQTMVADSTLSFTTANGNAIQVSDTAASTASLPIHVTLEVGAGSGPHGVLTVNATAGVTLQGSGTTTVTLQGLVAAVNAALATLSYTPTAGYTGDDSITITTNDLGATGGNPIVVLTDTDVVAITVIPNTEAKTADISVTNTSSSTTASIGQELVFTVTVTNHGPGTATGVKITDTLPPNIEFVSSSISPSATLPHAGLLATSAFIVPTSKVKPAVTIPQGQMLTFNLDDIVAGGSRTLQIVVRPTAAALGMSLVNTATVTTTSSDLDPSNNTNILSAAVMVVPTNPVPDNTDTTPPVLVSLQREGIHYQPTRLVLTFSEAMNPTSAQDLAAYTLVGAGADGKLGTKDDLVVRLRSATYDSATRTVTLHSRRRLSFFRPFQLTLDGSSAHSLSDSSGNKFDGNKDGKAGGNATLIFKGQRLIPDVQKIIAHARKAHRLQK